MATKKTTTARTVRKPRVRKISSAKKSARKKVTTKKVVRKKSKIVKDRVKKVPAKKTPVKKTPVKKSTVKKKVQIAMPSLQELLEAGSHFGHKTSRWNPLMEQYIFDSRDGTHIIDLTQTLSLLQEATEFLVNASKKGNILLVGTKGQAATLIKNAGVDHGAFYISRRWPGGLLTNFGKVRKSINRLIKIEEDLAAGIGYVTKKERVVLDREKGRLQRLYEGIRFMKKIPGVVVVIDTRVEKNAIKEAVKLGVKVVGIVDTNCDPSVVDHPIPANDDAIKSIELFINVLVQGFTSSDTSAKLIGERNDYISKLERIRRDAEVETERKKQEEELEIQRLKAMKEGTIVEGASSREVKGVKGKIVRVVRKGKTKSPAKE
ncbi:MAG: 30S ribosomal protein S2 [Patescibacteria group bacterium]|nr:30S ribosomal protein S2 [Patescibacteria group bacterium]